MELDDLMQPMRLDTQGLSIEDGLKLAHDLLGDDYQLSPLPDDPPRFQVAGDLWVMAELAAVHHQDMDCRLRRNPQDRLTRAVRYHTVGEGRMHGVIRGEPISWEPGDMFVISTDVPFVADMDGHSGAFISMSTATLDVDGADDVGYHILERGAPVTRMLVSLIDGFFARMADGVTIGEARALARLLRGSLEQHLGSLVQPRENAGDRPATWRQPMLDFIDDNLHDPDLGVETILQAFPASRAVVYRTMEEFGGVAKLILRRRLERALSMILFETPETSLREIAQCLGISNSSQFSTAFKKHFGIRPSEARQAFGLIKGANESREDSSGSERALLMREMHELSGHL